MNEREWDILNILLTEPYVNQRILSERAGVSLGMVNRAIGDLMEVGYLDPDCRPTVSAREMAGRRSPKNAVILAAGYGMRIVPINMETPKGLLEIKGEPLIERVIKQLQEVGIREIYVVVGFLKEQYEYLIDKYGVELVVNSEYSTKNNLHSLNCVVDRISNTYIVPCDVWCANNPFRRYELYSWYMVSDQADQESNVRVNRKRELVVPTASQTGNAMVGISYLMEGEAERVRARVRELCANVRYDGSFWEETLYTKDRMIVSARVVPAFDVAEINTYEQLRALDSDSNHLKSEAISVIMQSLSVSRDEISNITVLKKGMTNRSFSFCCRGNRYIMRIPGEGTDQLINRSEEAEVYRSIDGLGICDDVVYIDPDNGYKITEFLEEARVCDPMSEEDLRKCMEKLRNFHQRRLQVPHEFDLFRHIDFYESLWNGAPSIYRDYPKTKQRVLDLRTYIERHAGEKVLTHIDAVPDNFLICEKPEGEEIRLIDWEYAGMQDPHVDIAMFCIYAMYNRTQVDRLIDLYFEGACPVATRIKIYCYIAVCGLLWSNWCEYKRNLGVEFGEYSLRQYRYAKEYYRIVCAELERAGTVGGADHA